MDQVYLAYCASDRDFALLLMGEMEKYGVSVYMDRSGLRGNETWSHDAEQALQGAVALVVVMSRAAVLSPVATYEWASALARDLPVIPILAQSAALHPRLASRNPIDSTDAAPTSPALMSAILTRLPHGPQRGATAGGGPAFFAATPDTPDAIGAHGLDDSMGRDLLRGAVWPRPANPVAGQDLGHLELLLTDRDTEIQIAAATALAGMSSSEAAGPLEAALRRATDVNVRAAIIHALAVVGADALDYAILTGDLGPSYPDKRAGLAHMLRRSIFFSESSIAARAWELKIPEEEVRVRCEAMAARFGLETGWRHGGGEPGAVGLQNAYGRAAFSPVKTTLRTENATG